MSSCMMVSGCLSEMLQVFSLTIGASLLTCAQKRQHWRRRTMLVRAARGLENDTAETCWVVCACGLACLLCVFPFLAAELLPALLVQCGFVPLQRLLRLVRGRVVRD